MRCPCRKSTRNGTRKGTSRAAGKGRSSGHLARLGDQGTAVCYVLTARRLRHFAGGREDWPHGTYIADPIELGDEPQFTAARLHDDPGEALRAARRWHKNRRPPGARTRSPEQGT